MTSSLLRQELEPLKAQIGQIRGKLEAAEGELRVVEAELETFSTDKQRFDALRDVCSALDKLGELEASELFWEGMPGGKAAGHIERLRDRIVQFEGEIRGVEDKQKSLKAQVKQRHDELHYLHEEVRQAHGRDERRKDEFIIERELSPVPYRPMIMPWTNQGEGERRYRFALLCALLFSIISGVLIPMWKLPEPDRSAAIVIPERLAMLVKKEPPKPEPVPERPKEEKKAESEEKLQERPTEKRPTEQRPTPTSAETVAARNKAQSSGVLAFKSSFADLMDETPVARLGVEARLSNSTQAAGQAVAQRSLVAMQTQGGGGSGGIGNATVSRNVGSGNADRLGGGGAGVGAGGAGFARVTSAVAGLAAQESRPLSAGSGPARTDEEIQIVFDRYKASLYRIYNTELRKNPALRGKMVLRITIEPGGEVSVCKVESTDLASPELVAQIVERVKKFNFGPKDKVPKTTILYPIDFLPAG